MNKIEAVAWQIGLTVLVLWAVTAESDPRPVLCRRWDLTGLFSKAIQTLSAREPMSDGFSLKGSLLKLRTRRLWLQNTLMLALNCQNKVTSCFINTPWKSTLQKRVFSSSKGDGASFHPDWSFNQQTLTLDGFRRWCWISLLSALIQVTFSSSLITTCLWYLYGAHFRFQSLGTLKARLECALFKHRIVRLFRVVWPSTSMNEVLICLPLLLLFGNGGCPAIVVDLMHFLFFLISTQDKSQMFLFLLISLNTIYMYWIHQIQIHNLME